MPGGDDLEVRARRALLDAIDALGSHQDAVVLVGAQAIYLHTGEAPVALAPFTKDADLALDVRELGDDPLIEDAMTGAGLVLDPDARQPGTWLSRDGVPVDLLIPEALSRPGGRRGGRIPPHARTATRRVAGMEAAVVDRRPMTLRSFDPGDKRAFTVSVAGPAGLLVSKLHKVGERQATPNRLIDKDAHDVHRLLVAVPTATFAERLDLLRRDDLAGAATTAAIHLLDGLFGEPGAIGAVMAGRAEVAVGSPDVVAASTAALAGDLIAALSRVWQ
jgi:hypothetical protein